MTTRPWARAAVFVAGLFYALAALLMFAAPAWFYENIGHFPPYNRHYIGDVAAFTLPLGAGLMWAARDSGGYRLLVAVGLAASALHVGNHVVDARGEPLQHWLVDVGPLVLLGAALLLGWLAPGRATADA